MTIITQAIKITVITLLPKIPKLLNKFYTHFFEEEKIIIHKKIDKSLFTQSMYDYAIAVYDTRFFKTQKELTNHLNSTFKTNKSVTSMARLFKGKIDRDTLALGIQYKTFSNIEDE